VGTPVWAANSTPAVNTYLKKFKDEFKTVAIFSTSGSTPIGKTVNSLEKILDKKVKYFAGWNSDELKDEKKYLDNLKKFVDDLN
jgi:hypothetical protein